MADNAEDEKVLENEEEVEKDEEEAPVRQSAAYFAQQRIIKKQEKKIKQLEKGDDSDEETELTPKAQDLIRKELEPVVVALKNQADELEFREYLADHPEHKKFEKAARKRFVAWANVPVAEVFKTLTYGETQREKSEESEAAKAKIKANKLGGGSARATEPKLPSTQEEYAAIYKNVKKGGTVKLGE